MKKSLASEIKTDRLEMQQCLSAEQDVVRYHIFSENELVGALAVYFDHAEELTEPDIEIAPTYRRRGYALEAMDALLNAIIGTYPNYTLVAVIPMDDEPANCLCKRLDFIFDCVDAEEKVNYYSM